MKTAQNTLLTLLATTMILLPVNALAHCGACGAGESHAATAEHPTKTAKETKVSAKTPAIYPLAKEAGFTTLAAAIEAAGLDKTLTDGGPFTVFAPTDEAFAKLPEGTVEKLLANPEQLKKVLLFHVVSGKVMAADVVKLKSADSLAGQKLMISTKDGVMVNNAKVIKTDVAASNGVIHVIDTVLIPENK